MHVCASTGCALSSETPLWLRLQLMLKYAAPVIISLMRRICYRKTDAICGCYSLLTLMLVLIRAVTPVVVMYSVQPL